MSRINIPANHRQYWLRWTLNCSFGELCGLGAAGAMAYLAFHWIGEPATLPAKLLVLLLMMTAGAIEGSLLGYFQWRG